MVRFCKTINKRDEYKRCSMRQHNRSETYKASFVDFIQQIEWDRFITIGIGHCPDDAEVLRRLRLIEARLCKRYLLNRYHKLPHRDRFTMAVAFEGERTLGTRHAHILVHIPRPLKHCASRLMLVSLFPWQFQFLWHSMRPEHDRYPPPWQPRVIDKPMVFGRVNTARKIYTVKRVQQIELPWSRFEFVTPPKTRKFQNQNLSVIRNRDRQKRIALKRREGWQRQELIT